MIMNNLIEVHYIMWYLLYYESQCRHHSLSSLLQPTWEIADSKCKRYLKNIGRVYPLKMVSFYANWSRFANITLLWAQIVRKKKSVRPLSQPYILNPECVTIPWVSHTCPESYVTQKIWAIFEHFLCILWWVRCLPTRTDWTLTSFLQ